MCVYPPSHFLLGLTVACFTPPGFVYCLCLCANALCRYGPLPLPLVPTLSDVRLELTRYTLVNTVSLNRFISLGLCRLHAFFAFHTSRDNPLSNGCNLTSSSSCTLLQSRHPDVYRSSIMSQFCFPCPEIGPLVHPALCMCLTNTMRVFSCLWLVGRLSLRSPH